jgi:hypothetical protein
VIKVTVELWPFGSEREKVQLGEMFIWNDGTGTGTRGNYKFWYGGGKNGLNELRSVQLGDNPPKGVLKNFPRKSYTVFELIKRCLNEVKKVR